MKTPSDDLFKLIKSLDTQEKVHFKLFAQRKGGDSNHYILVFDAINEMEEYKEEDLRKSLKKHPLLVKNLKRVKQYTLDAVLKSLSAYHSYTTVQSEIRNLLHQAEILSGKKLFRIANKILDKAETLAQEHDQLEYSLLVSGMRAELASRSEDIESVKKYIANNIPHEKEYVEKIGYDIGFRELGFKTYLLNLNMGFGRKAKEDILKLLSQSSLLSIPVAKLSSTSKGYFYRLHYTAALAKGIPDRKDRERHLERIKQLESDIKKLPRLAEIYLSAIANLIVLNTYFNEKEQTSAYLSKTLAFYHALPAKIKTELVASALGKVINNYMHAQIVWLEPATAVNAWKKISQTLPQMSRLLEKDLLNTIYSNLFQCHFLLEEYKTALAYVNKVIDHKQTTFRLDVQLFSRFYLLMIHYELGNMDLLDYLCDATERWLSKMNFLGSYEKKILFFFRKTIHEAQTKMQKARAFKDLKKQLEQLAPNAKGVVMEYLVPWIESKIEEKSFIDILKQKDVHGHG